MRSCSLWLWCAVHVYMHVRGAAALVGNPLGSPQDLGRVSGVPICANRSSFCNALLDVPMSCSGTNSTRCPVLFCLHGFGGSNRRYVDLCGPVVHSRGFIGVYPQGDPLAGPPGHPEGFGWNDGMSVNPNNTRLRCAWDDYSCTVDPNDTLFFERMVSALRAAGADGFLFAFGQSNGADWAHRLGANAGPALPFVGIAPQSCPLVVRPPRSAAGPRNLNQPTLAAPPVAVLAVHGTDDTSIPYAGGPKFGSPVFVMYSEPGSNAVWAAHNGCTGGVAVANVTANYSHEGVQATGVATHHVYSGCPAAAPVEWYQTHGAGHVGTEALGGAPVVAVVATFFERVERALQLRA